MPPKAKVPKPIKVAIHLKFIIVVPEHENEYQFNKTSDHTKEQFIQILDDFLEEDLISDSLFPEYPNASVEKKSMTKNKDGITLKAKLKFENTTDDVATITSKMNRMIQTLGMMNRSGVDDDKTKQTYYITSIKNINDKTGGTKKRKNASRRATRKM